MSSRLEQLLEMLKAEPQDAFLRYAVALEYEAAGNIAEAISRIESLLSDNPDYLGAFYQLGQYYEMTGQPDRASIIYERGIELARQKGNTKTLGELQTALNLL